VFECYPRVSPVTFTAYGSRTFHEFLLHRPSTALSPVAYYAPSQSSCRRTGSKFSPRARTWGYNTFRPPTCDSSFISSPYGRSFAQQLVRPTRRVLLRESTFALGVRSVTNHHHLGTLPQESLRSPSAFVLFEQHVLCEDFQHLLWLMT
jgi:hypothetical protein